MSALLLTLLAACVAAAPERWDESRNAALFERVAREARENVARRRTEAVAARRPSGVGGESRVELEAALRLLSRRSSAVPARWAGLSGHRAVASAARLRLVAPGGLLPLQLSLSLPLTGEPSQPLAEGLATLAGGREAAEAYLRDLAAFVERARFEEWLEQTLWERRALEDSFSTQAAELASAARYLGALPVSVRVVPSLLWPGAKIERLVIASSNGGEVWLVRGAEAPPMASGEAARELFYAAVNLFDSDLSSAGREEAVRALWRRISSAPPVSPAEERLLEYEKDRARYPTLERFWPRLKETLESR